MYLTATDETLELQTLAALSTDWMTQYADHTSSSFAPDSNEGNVATATTTTIVAAPAASTQRQVKSVIVRNRDATSAQTVILKKDKAGTEYRMSPDVTLQPGEVLIYVDGAPTPICVLDATGRVKVANSYPGRISSLLLPGLNHNAALTGTKTLTSGTAFAVYVGKAPRALSSVQVRYRVTTAAATITWAEVALAKGPINIGANPSLTVVGFADVSAVINSTGVKTTTVNVSSGQSINEGDDLWLIIGNAATTAGVVRALTIADDLQVGVQASVASRPSTIVGTATAFTIEGATTLAPWAVGVV